MAEFVEGAREEGADVFQVEAPQGCYYPPTLITGYIPCLTTLGIFI